MANSDFDIRNGMLQRYTGPGGDEVLPPEVRSIGADAFADCETLRTLRIDGKMDFIGTDAFARCPNLSVCAPQHPPGDAWDAESRLRMALGYCAAPELYQGDVAAAYARYAKGQRKRIESAARRMGLTAALQYFPEEPEKPVNYKKLSEKQKVLALEEAVLSGDMDRVEAVLTGCKTFEFTARALGLACRFGSLPMVRRLVEAGCNFHLTQDVGLTSKYDIYTNYTGYFNSRLVWHRFEYMLMADTLTDKERFGDFRGLTGILPEGDGERPPIPEAERLEILRCLTTTKSAQTDLEGLFYTAVTEGRDPFMQVFLDQNVPLTSFDVSRLESRQRMDVLPRMLNVAKAQGRCQVPVTLGILQSVQDDAALVERLLDEGKLPNKLDTTKLLKGSLAAANAGTLTLCLNRGFCRSIATRDKLIEQSIAENRPEHTAALLAYKNRTADLQKEAAQQEARDLKDLTAAPDSVYMMKKFWQFKKQEDGTLILTGYKGPGGAVWVPERIGKDPVTAIGERAFSPLALRLTAEQKEQRETAVTSVTIPKTITSLGRMLFEGCRSLKEVHIEASVTTLEKQTFRNCAALRRVTLPEGLKVIQETAFEYCVSLEHITLPQSLQYLHNGAFGHCYALREIELPAEVKKLGKWLFQDCQSLTRAVLPEGLTELPDDLFRACERLREVTIPRKVRVICSSAFEGCWALTEIDLPPRVRELEYGVFRNCTGLERITLPENLGVISSFVFSNCKKLKSIRLPRTMTRIGANAFENCVSLRTVEMPNSLRDLHIGAFENCAALRSITLPQSLKEIDSTVFKNCTALEEVTLPPFIQRIGNYAFYNCAALRHVDIPITLASIGPSAFQGCTALTSMDLPEIIQHIGGRAFEGCTALKTVIIRANATKFGDVTDLRNRFILDTADVFDSCKDLTIHAKAGSSAAAHAKEHNIPLTLL